MRKHKFSDFMRELEAEAKAEGPEAVDELTAFRDYFRFAREMAEARKARGLSQTDLARRSGVHQSEISDIERGTANPTFRTLQSIARGLGRRVAFVATRTRTSKRAARRRAQRRTVAGGGRG